MYPDYKEERAAAVGIRNPEPGWFGLRGGNAVKFKLPGGEDKDSAIPIRGINSDLPVRFAPDGGAVPGDRIVGIMTPGEGITIYPIQSSALKDFEETSGTLARRPLGRRWRHPAAVSRADLRAVRQRAGVARPDRPGDRRA